MGCCITTSETSSTVFVIFLADVHLYTVLALCPQVEGLTLLTFLTLPIAGLYQTVGLQTGVISPPKSKKLECIQVLLCTLGLYRSVGPLKNMDKHRIV